MTEDVENREKRNYYEIYYLVIPKLILFKLFYKRRFD